MLSYTKFKGLASTALITATLLTPLQASAADWSFISTVTNVLAWLFPPAQKPQLVQPQQMSSSGSTYYEDIGNSYPVAQVTGRYQYTGSDGLTYAVNNDQGQSNLIDTVLNPAYQVAGSSGLVSDGTGGLYKQPDGGYPWPVAGGPISSTFGNRERVGKMCHKDDRGDGQITEHCGIHAHNGIDMAVAAGTPVTSVTDGKVVWISPACRGGAPGEAGCTVSIMKPDGEMSTYMHLSGTSSGLSVGDEVGQGEQFALSGNSGTATTGAHLHFEMCQVPPERADGKTNPLALCNMGERINPLSRLSTTDSRYANACRMTERNPLNAGVKKPCNYAGGKRSTASAMTPAPLPESKPIDVRQSDIAPDVF